MDYFTLVSTYESYEKGVLWKTLEEAIDDLSKNNDLILQTRHELIIGYICKKIAESKLTITETDDSL